MFSRNNKALLANIVVTFFLICMIIVPIQAGAEEGGSDGCGLNPFCWAASAVGAQAAGVASVVLDWLSSLLLSLFAGILLFAGKVFDTFVLLMVVHFSDTFGGVFFEVLKEAWKIVRDFANIAIIGVFVFVAIMTILGRADYGAKALIAKVLVVAILINFSFLFTELIISSSNFMSEQLWKTFSPPTQQKGTGQTMLEAFGIKDYWNDTSALVENVSNGADTSGAGFLYALIGGVVIISLSLVLLYGAFLVTTRALLLLFALLSSSFAFASFMLPSAANLPYIGWSAWWSNLLKAAVFGPVLILFLRIFTLMLEKINVSGAGKALSAAAANPNNSSILWEQLILLIVVTAMLFVAMRAAGSFSNSIGGYGMAANVAGFLPLLFNRSLAAGIRKTRGTAALAKKAEIEADIDRAKKAGRWAEVGQLSKNLEKVIARTKSDYDVAKTSGGKAVLSALGISPTLAGEKYGGAAGIASKLGKENAEKYKAFAMNKETQEAIAKEAGDAARSSGQATVTMAKENRDAQARNLEEERRILAEKHQAAQEEERGAKERLKKEVSEDKMMKDLHQKLASELDGEARKGIRNQISSREQQIRAEHQSMIDEKTDVARRALAAVNQHLAQTKNTLDTLDDHVSSVKKKLEDGVKVATAEAVKQSKKERDAEIYKQLPWLQRTKAGAKEIGKKIDPSDMSKKLEKIIAESEKEK